MRIKIFLLCAVVMTLAMCSSAAVGPAASPVLISKNFIDDNTYRIVCRGFPAQGLSGLQRNESAMRAARLNAYLFIKSDFVDSVAPDRDGSVEKFEVTRDYAVIYYVVSKRGLKKLLRPESKEEAAPRPETRTDPDKGPARDAEKSASPEPDKDASPKPGPDGASSGGTGNNK